MTPHTDEQNRHQERKNRLLSERKQFWFNVIFYTIAIIILASVCYGILWAYGLV